MELESSNSESNRGRNFKSVSRCAFVQCDHSLNCTPLGPITTNNRVSWYSQDSKSTRVLFLEKFRKFLQENMMTIAVR